jgi:hypothetical protein
MSDGMSDANAMGNLVTELREAAYALRDAIKAARRGHRGMVLTGICEEVNEKLRGTPYRLIRMPVDLDDGDAP